MLSGYRTLPMLLLALLSVTGCAGDPEPYRAHYLFIHRDGFALNDKFDGESTDSLRARLDNTILKGIQQHVDDMKKKDERTGSAGPAGCDGVLRLLIFVHGGMNTKGSSIERMQKMLVDNNRVPATCYYPVFVNWRSGFVSATVDDLFRLRFGRPSWTFGIATSPFVLVGRMLGSIANLPMSIAHNVENVVEAANGAAEQGDPAGCTTGDVVLYAPLQALYAVSIPFVEGFGKPAWEIMKRRAQLTVATRLTDDPEVSDFLVEKARASKEARQAKAATSAHPNEGAIRTLVWKLRERIKYHEGTQAWYWLPPDRASRAEEGGGVMPAKTVTTIDPQRAVPVEITLVGHSMGAIILNRVLSILDIEEEDSPVEQPLPVRQIIYMAPAASINELEYFLVPYLYYNKEVRFSMFVLNRRDETREVPMGGSVFFLPRGSLLAWIDTFLEPEASVGQSTSGRMRNLREYYALSDSPDFPGTKNCVTPYWDAEQYRQPAPEDRGLWQQYTDIRLKDYSPRLTRDLGDRFRFFESPARVRDKTAPKEHGDFTEPHYFLEVLCHADGKAFRDWKATCTQKPYWAGPPPWYAPWAADESYQEFPPVFAREALAAP